MTFKCKSCGGTLNVAPGSTTCVCNFCGNPQTLPDVHTEEVANLFNRANHLRMRCEFDKAETAYEKIIERDSKEAEAHWGAVLCRYGIEYVEDPASGKRIPTCHRTLYESVKADADYQAAIQYADSDRRALYEAEATEIDRLQKDILAIVQKEKPFDVFICYKEKDEQGNRTKDSVTAANLHRELTREGLKVFYAPITLEDKLGQDYEPYIFAALTSAKVMLVVGSKAENFNAPWVKNEWSRFLKQMTPDHKKLLIPCYEDIDAYDLPDEFSHLQAQDMSKLGFLLDLLHVIKKICVPKKEEPKPQPSPAPTGNTQDVEKTNPLLRRMYILLEDSNWNEADACCEKILNTDPECAEAYLGKLMIEYQANKPEMLSKVAKDFSSSLNYDKIMRFGDATIKEKIKKIETERWYQNAVSLSDQAKSCVNYQKTDDREILKDIEKAEGLYTRAIDCGKNIPGYQDIDQIIAYCEIKKNTIRKDFRYDEAVTMHDRDPETKMILEFAISALKEISPWRDSEEKIKQYTHELAVLTANEGDYESAIKLLEEIIPWKDSDEKIKQYSYELAILNANKGDYESAIKLLEKIDSWKNSPQKLEEYKELYRQQTYERAESAAQKADYQLAAELMDKIAPWKDSGIKSAQYHKISNQKMRRQEKVRRAFERMVNPLVAIGLILLTIGGILLTKWYEYLLSEEPDAALFTNLILVVGFAVLAGIVSATCVFLCRSRKSLLYNVLRLIPVIVWFYAAYTAMVAVEPDMGIANFFWFSITGIPSSILGLFLGKYSADNSWYDD